MTWRDEAACRGVPVNLMFNDATRETARQVCWGCHVSAECLADVMKTEDPRCRDGIVGGLTPDQRYALYRKIGRRGAAHPQVLTPTAKSPSCACLETEEDS
jgi:hypothetical protein